MLGQSLRKSAVSASLVFAVVLGASAVSPVAGQVTAPAPAVKGKAKARVKAVTKTPIDLNHATAEEMAETLPGVGEATARKIVAGRPYASVNDLSRADVPARTVEAIRPLVTVGPATPARTTSRTPAPGSTPKTAAPGRMATPASAPGARVNLNTATAAELQTLPGVGPAYAREIIAARPFRSVDELSRLKGLGPARVEAIRNRVVVGEPTAPVATAPVAPVPTPAPATTTAPTGAMRKSAATGAASKAALPTRVVPGQVVNLNTASREQLDALPGIGPVKAQAIIEGRPFKTKEDVMKVRGIKEGEFAKIRDLITVQ